MWPFTRKPKPRDWWKPEYDELSNFNALQMRASGNQYRMDATETERATARRAAQDQLDHLPESYVQRMALIQADYNETYRRAHGARG